MYVMFGVTILSLLLLLLLLLLSPFPSPPSPLRLSLAAVSSFLAGLHIFVLNF